MRLRLAEMLSRFLGNQRAFLKNSLTDLQQAAFYMWCSVDPNENLGGRDDALMELGKFDFLFVQQFQEGYVCRRDEDEMLLDSAGESLC